MPDDPSLQPAPSPSPSSESLRDESRQIAPWRWWLHLLVIAAYVLWIGAVSLQRGEETAPALSSTTSGLLWTSGIGLLIFGLVIGAAWLSSRASRDDLLLRWRQGFWPLPLGIGYSIALRLAVGIVAVCVALALVGLGIVSSEELPRVMQGNTPDVSAVVSVSSLRDNPAYFWIMVTFVSFVVAGLREELWRAAFIAGMRGLWPKRFATRRAQMLAVIVAAVVFGFGHISQGLMGATLAGLLGLGLGAIMVLHRSIWPAVIAHGCFDATSFALLPWAMEKLQELQRALPQ